MKRPLVLVALPYVGGVLLANFVSCPPALLLATAFVLLLAALAWWRVRSLLLWPLLLVMGWTNLTLRTAILSPHDLRLAQSNSTQIVTVRGILSETPSQRIYVRDEKDFSRSLAQVRASQIAHGKSWQPTLGQILVTTPGDLPGEFFGGQLVEIRGVLGPPPGPLAEGLFDYRTYLRRQGIYYQLKAESANDWRILSSKRSRPLGDRFLVWAQRTLARGLPAEDESLRLLWAMTLGWKTGLTNEVSEPFMRSGTMHIFAISGLHIALIAGILVSLLRVLQFSRAWCGVVVIPLIWFYTAATGWQPSAIRSTVMMSIIIGGWALKRPSELVNSLFAAAFIILLWEPEQLFQASFQLSFCVVLSIGLLLPPLEKISDRLLRTDPLLPAHLAPRWRRWTRARLRYLTPAIATSLAAWLGSLPLVAYYFHLWSPVTLLPNLVIVPLSSLALACNLGSLICGDWFPWATELFNYSAWWWMACMIKLSDWATLLPKAYLYVRGPGVVDFVLYYAVLLAALCGWFFRPKLRSWAWTGLAMAGAFYLWQWQTTEHTMNLTILPLNGGSSVFFDPPGSKNDLLVDCGTVNSVQLITKPFLRAQGVNRLKTIALTHGDIKRIGGAELLGKLFAVKQVCASPVRFRSPAYRQALDEFSRTPEKLRTIRRNHHLGPWTVLHPEAEEHFAQADDNAVVLHGSINGTRVLLLSDLGRSGQNVLLERAPDLRAEIVVSGLPVKTEPLCDALLDRIQPRLIIITDSEFPASDRASLKLCERLGRRNVPVIYTRSAGAATIEFHQRDWTVRTMSEIKVASETIRLTKAEDER